MAISLKGIEYEYRLGLYVALGAILNNYHDFRVACDTKKHKFDDVVFCYIKKEAEIEEACLIQAKNTQPIFIDSRILLESSGDYSLATYCNTYRQIKKDCTLTNVKIKELIVFTTSIIAIKSVSTFKKNFDSFEKEEETDAILQFTSSSNRNQDMSENSVQPTRYKMEPNEVTKNQIRETIHSFNLQPIADKLIDCLLDNKTFNSDFHLLLSDYVLDADTQADCKGKTYNASFNPRVRSPRSGKEPLFKEPVFLYFSS